MARKNAHAENIKACRISVFEGALFGISPPKPSSPKDSGEVGGAVLHDDVKPCPFAVDDAVVVANDERVPQLAEDIHLLPPGKKSEK